MDRMAADAQRGRLDRGSAERLESVPVDDPAYTRSRAILLMDAQRRGDARAAGRHLEDLMRLPENQYDPVFLSELSRVQVNRRQYQAALSTALKAEQHWARLPSTLVFDKKAEIFEVQAAATQGLLYESDDLTAQLGLIDDAILRWRRLQEHGRQGGSASLEGRALSQIQKLEDIRRRLQ
jgi:hypothetical protein